MKKATFSTYKIPLLVCVIVLSILLIYTTHELLPFEIVLIKVEPLEDQIKKDNGFKGSARTLPDGEKPSTVQCKSSINSSVAEGEDLFMRMAEKVHMKCPRTKRMGNARDGGWNICVSPPYQLEKNCIVYSFGINYDFSFDKAISEKYGCLVIAYDPSMNRFSYAELDPGSGMMISDNIMFYKIGLSNQNRILPHNGWAVATFGTLLKKNHHSNETIDVLKIDIELGEWSSLLQMFEEGSLARVKQLVLEVHSMETFQRVFSKPNEHHYIEMCSILLELELLGFRKYQSHLNPFCAKLISRNTNRLIKTCYELSYLNSKYLHQII